MTRQFDLVTNPDHEDAIHRPFLLVLQSDLVSGLRSTIVAPLVVRQALAGASRLNPIVRVEGQELWLAVHELFAIEQRLVRNPVANIDHQRDAIIGALDFLFTGY
jgi:toxin CcdB